MLNIQVIIECSVNGPLSWGWGIHLVYKSHLTLCNQSEAGKTNSLVPFGYIFESVCIIKIAHRGLDNGKGL